jgi:hypothetical protein
MIERSPRSPIPRPWIIVAAFFALAFAACGNDGSNGEAASESPTSTATQAATDSSDPLEGEWRTEFTCRDSVAAIQRRLSPQQIQRQIGGWKEFLAVWGAKPTSEDPCHRATGTTALLARFTDGNLALCDAKTLQCEVNATYELVHENSIKVDDPEGNLCSHCPVEWEFELSGDELRFRVSPDAFVLSAWEASPWIRQGGQ